MSKKDIDRQKIYLAGLLHDIGKFYQRADDNGTSRSKELSDAIKQNQNTYCPVKNGVPTHKHVLWTAQFILDFEEIFKRVFSENHFAYDKVDSFFQLAVKHHNPVSEIEKIVQLADWYSSGMDREDDPIAQEEIIHEGKRWDDFKQVKMVSIFEGILKKTDKDYKYGIPVEKLSLKEECFPEKGKRKDSGAPEAYKSIWDGFTREVEKIKSSSFDAFANTFLALLQKYTSSVPSSTQHLQDVSLFDHLKSVAALSICIYDYLDANNKLDNIKSISKNTKPLLLVGGDISGIQKFIYDIIGSDAAKNLKGRSFYLKLLADSVVSSLLKKLDLYDANIIYSSGGGFYLLAPNTSESINIIKAFENEITTKLFKEHNTSLFFALDVQEISQEEIYDREIGNAWKILTQKLSKKKRQRYKTFFNTSESEIGYSTFFEPDEVTGEEKRDRITNDIIRENENIKNISDRDGEEKWVKYSTWEQIELGKKLKETDYIIKTSDKIPYWNEKKDISINPCQFGTNYYFINQNDLYNKYFQNKASVDKTTIIKLNKPDFLNSEISGKDNTLGFEFYGGNDFPVDNLTRWPKTFDELAGDENTGLKRLGVLRMDVDNLGQIFINGFDSRMKTFSRYSTLSRNLDYFFKGYLNKIWSNNDKFKAYTYILYSGGDDLFIVGKWNYLIEFAEAIQSEFKKWTCYNPFLGISGGISIVPGKFPIAKAASMAEKAEKLAKSHKGKDGKYFEKNSFTLLDTPLNWDDEYLVVKKLKEQLCEFIPESIPKTLLMKIQTFAIMKADQQKKGQNESWRWLMAYDFGRASNRLKSQHVDAREFLTEIQKNSFTNNWKEREKSKYEFIDLLNIAARWAEMEIRS